MDSFVTAQQVADLITFIAPGYFAIKTYDIVYARAERDWSRTLVESIVFSLPIMAIYNLLWNDEAASATRAVYVLPLLLGSIALGWLFAWLRVHRPAKQLFLHLGLPTPDNDFIRAQFKKLAPSEPVTVTLKSGEVFSGTPVSGNVVRSGIPRQYYFNDIAWFNKKSDMWEERPGSLLIDLSEVSYIETSQALNKD